MSDKPRVLVAGGAGYIGSHCCKMLHGAGYLPICLDNFSTGHRNFVKWGPSIEADILDEPRLVSVLEEHKVVAVLHLAASSLVSESVTNPELYYRNNVEGTLSLLRAMLHTGCRKIVFSSSGAVYGDGHNGLIKESDLTRPVNPYGRTKLIVEEMLADFARAYRFHPVCLRYFNASGAEISGEIGECHDPETHLIPRALLAVCHKEGELAIYGGDYDTPDGTAIRDYVHVTDLAHAHVLALQRLLAGAEGGRYNLGTGRGHSVKQILEQVFAVTGRKTPFVIKQRRAGDPAVLVADPGMAKLTLGFSPEQSDLRTIISSAWNWHQVSALRRTPRGCLPSHRVG